MQFYIGISKLNMIIYLVLLDCCLDEEDHIQKVRSPRADCQLQSLTEEFTA
jgi:hypothetical protein